MLRNNFGLRKLSGHRSALFGVGPMIYRTRFYPILSVLPSVSSIRPPLEATITFYRWDADSLPHPSWCVNLGINFIAMILKPRKLKLPKLQLIKSVPQQLWKTIQQNVCGTNERYRRYPFRKIEQISHDATSHLTKPELKHQLITHLLGLCSSFALIGSEGWVSVQIL